jgi:hypothetical protein
MSKPIFVFTTTLDGAHLQTISGKHAAIHYYTADGCFGPTSETYAIPTLDFDHKKLPLYRLMPFVHEFILYAMRTPDKTFFVPVFEDHKAKEIAPLFKLAPKNILVPPVYLELL